MNVDDAFHGISTLLIATLPDGRSQGTGFFYQAFEPHDPNEPGWAKIEKLWLVTNRHVVLPQISGKEAVPDSFSFHLRKTDNKKILWDPVTIPKDELLKRAKFHPNENVDVCIIDILDLLTDRVIGNDRYLQWYGVSKKNLPGSNNIFVEVAEDVIVIGYPRGFYDRVNLFPIVKSGIVASRWGASFGGEPYFLIDAKLFPGSSGSIVVSKPKDVVVVDGKMMFAKEKQFAFLGIYSGEPIAEYTPIEMEDITIIRKSGFNLGIVWYGYLVEEIISSGKAYGES